jgi:hypothetical protein
MERNSGKAFVADFERYMRRRRYNTELNPPMKGKRMDRPWDCDIHGWRTSLFRSLLAVLFLAICIGAVFVNRSPEQAKAMFGLDFTDLSELSIPVAVLAGFFALLAWANSNHHVWVECKDLKSTIKRDHILKVVDACKDVKRFDGKWKPNEIWFASSSEYDVDALNYARHEGVRCFVRRGSGARFAEL